MIYNDPQLAVDPHRFCSNCAVTEHVSFVFEQSGVGKICRCTEKTCQKSQKLPARILDRMKTTMNFEACVCGTRLEKGMLRVPPSTNISQGQNAGRCSGPPEPNPPPPTNRKVLENKRTGKNSLNERVQVNPGKFSGTHARTHKRVSAGSIVQGNRASELTLNTNVFYTGCRHKGNYSSRTNGRRCARRF